MVKSVIVAALPNFRYNNDDDESLYIVAPSLVEFDGSRTELLREAATLDVILVAGLAGVTVKELFGEIATTKARSDETAPWLPGLTVTGP